MTTFQDTVDAILSAAISHALALGVFETVAGHEPKVKNPAGPGTRCALWVQSIGPARGASGLNSTTARLELTARVYTGMLAEPQDSIDPRILTGTCLLMDAYGRDFTLGGLIKQVDLLGACGTPLSAKAGYVNQDGKLFRVMETCLPLIVNDLWPQRAA